MMLVFMKIELVDVCSGLITQLEKLVNRPDLIQHFWHYLSDPNEDDTMFNDIYDGAVFKEFQQTPKPGDQNCWFTRKYLYEIALQLNADGFQAYKDTAHSITAVFAVVLNLPREIRFKQENVILLCLIPG
jgi:hypothetical protein